MYCQWEGKKIVECWYLGKRNVTWGFVTVPIYIIEEKEKGFKGIRRLFSSYNERKNKTGTLSMEKKRKGFTKNRKNIRIRGCLAFFLCCSLAVGSGIDVSAESDSARKGGEISAESHDAGKGMGVSAESYVV